MINGDVLTTEALILDAAVDEFLDKGFDAARTTEIARRAGVTHAMLHYYYRTKENLFNKVFEMKSRQVINSLLEFIDEELPFEEKLARGIGHHIDFLKSNPKLPQFIFSSLTAKPDRLDRMQQMIGRPLLYILQRFRTELEREIEQGRMKPIGSFDLLLSVISMNVFIFIAQPIVRRVAQSNGLSFDEMIERRKQENIQTILARLRT